MHSADPVSFYSEAGNSLLCVVQDPAYSALEKSFLRTLSLNVVDDPDAFSCIDAGSLFSTFLLTLSLLGG
jgi:FPC/CPF motif-containing protein YcgG